MDFLTANDVQGQYPATYYASQTRLLPELCSLKGEISCDVCVVGGGFTGLSSALHLAQRGYDVVLLEAHRIGWGASGRNGGQVGSGQRLGQDELENLLGKQMARELWQIALQSTQLVQQLISKHEIDCGYRTGIIHADHRKRFVAHTHAYAKKLQAEYGYEAIRILDEEQVRHLIGSKSYFGGALDMGSGHLNPLQFATGLARVARDCGVAIYENSRVLSVERQDPAIVSTDKARIKARYVILGCNGYLGNLAPSIASRVMPINNYIVATEPLSPKFARSLLKENYAVADSKFVVNYFRLSPDNRLLFGGGETYGYKFPKNLSEIVAKPMLEIFPQLKTTAIDYAWGGTLAITMNRMPLFERVEGNILSASGYSGHGVALATLAGQIMADAIEGQSTRFDIMANVPIRRFPGGTLARWPLLVLAMIWYSLRDKF